MDIHDFYDTDTELDLLSYPDSDKCLRIGLRLLDDFRSSEKEAAWSDAHIRCENKHLSVMTTPPLHCHASYAKAVSDLKSSLPPSTATKIATHAGLAPKTAIDAASIASKAAGRNQLAVSKPPVTRGKRGQLSYDTQQLDPRKAARLLSNRASAAQSQQRRAERAREAEAALARSRAENVMLQEQLAAALRIIEQLGHSAPLAALPAFESDSESLSALEPSASVWGS